MQSKRTKVTLSDIARESGLSLSTVSLALNEKPGLPLETRLRVIHTARQLGYPMRIAPAARTTALRTLGMLVKCSVGDEVPPTTNIFFSHVIAGIESACRQNNLSLMYSSLLVDGSDNTLEIPRLISDPNVDGLLLVGNFVDQRLDDALQQRGLPTLLVDAYCDSHRYDSVVTDNLESATLAVNYLLKCGHRHIAYVGSTPSNHLSFRYRRQGYQQALSAAGISERYYGDCLHNDHAAIVAVTRKLLAENPQITAILGCNDEVAQIAIHGALDVGKRVPEDVSIMGFDNSSYAEISLPPLTTMHIDKMSMGRLAVEMLLSRSENPDQAPITVSLHTHIVERVSVTALRP